MFNYRRDQSSGKMGRMIRAVMPFSTSSPPPPPPTLGPILHPDPHPRNVVGGPA